MPPALHLFGLALPRIAHPYTVHFQWVRIVCDKGTLGFGLTDGADRSGRGEYELIFLVWDGLDVEGLCTAVGAAVHLDNDILFSVQLYQAAQREGVEMVAQCNLDT